MLRFCDTNIYYSYELSNDICDEIWTTNFPACVDQNNGEAIYEGVKCHLIKEKGAVHKSFFDDKHAVALDLKTFINFLIAWHSSCIQNKLISNSIDIATWCTAYNNCYDKYYESINIFEGALSYYEALAVYESKEIRGTYDKFGEHIRFDFNFDSVIPELSWMLYDYKKYGKTIWEDYLNKVVKSNILNIRYKIALLESQGTIIARPSVPLDDSVELSTIDLNDEGSLIYFCNPFKPEFDTNYLFIEELLKKSLS